MSHHKHIKVMISGAAGQIGYALVFRVASGQMFGPDTTVDLHLLELPQSLATLEGVAMEITDCAFPLVRNVVCTSDVKVAAKGIHCAVLVGSVPRKAGMERSDLLKINGAIFTEQGRAINDFADASVRVFVVGNPCNTNCLIAMHNAPDISRKQFFAMTMLDQNRAYGSLAAKANVNISDITNLAIWGNHSATQYPDFYNAKIKGQAVTDVIRDINWLENDFITTVQQRGAAVIKARGASSAASAACGAIDSIHHLYFDTPADNVFSIASCSEGDYGIDEGLIFSFPTRVKNGKVEIVKGWQHNAFGKERIERNLIELRSEYEAVKELKLINA